MLKNRIFEIFSNKKKLGFFLLCVFPTNFFLQPIPSPHPHDFPDIFGPISISSGRPSMAIGEGVRDRQGGGPGSPLSESHQGPSSHMKH